MDAPPLVIDSGSLLTKCGFGGETAPRSIFPTLVGRPKSPGIMVGMDAKDCFVGAEAESKRGILKVKYPVEHGCVENWNDFEKVMSHILRWEFKLIDEEDSIPPPVFSAFSPRSPLLDRWKLAALFFETLRVPAFFLAPQQQLSLVGSGRETGLVVDIGAGAIHALPVYQGHGIPCGLGAANFGGRDIVAYLVKLLAERGYELTTTYERAIVRDVMEKLCFVKGVGTVEEEEGGGEDESDDDVIYGGAGILPHRKLPDGSKMPVTQFERVQAPEVLFQPSLIGEDECLSVTQLVAKSLSFFSDDAELQQQMAQNIVLAGGVSQFPNLEERLRRELLLLKKKETSEVLLPETSDFSIDSPSNPQISAWVGGSVLSTLSSFGTSWMTKKEYDEFGADLVRRKCF